MSSSALRVVCSIDFDEWSFIELMQLFFPFPPVRVKGMNKEKEAYRRLKEVPEKALATSGYSEINLAKLFQAFSSLK